MDDSAAGVIGTPCDKPGDTKTVDGVDLMCDKDGKKIVWMKNKYQSADPNGSDGAEGSKPDKVDYPDSKNSPQCPADLDGILTSPMFNPEDLAVITPLGNVTPPGHTAPIDHQYILPSRAGKIDLYAPADGSIARLITTGYSEDGGKTLQLEGFVISVVVCRGLVLESTGNASLADLNPALRAALPDDPAKAPGDACKFGISKIGHVHQWEWMCDFREIDVPVKSGELLASLNSVKSPRGGFDFGVETWLANYNVDPPDNGIHWDWYDDNRYVHSTCLFDKFSPEVNAAYVAKLGGANPLAKKGDKGYFFRINAKDKDPVCGVTVQDTFGTLLGYWFGAEDTQSKFGVNGAQYGDNSGISFIRNNANPDAGTVVEGGGLVPGSTVIGFVPQHSGSIDRDPVEVTPGPTVYCYNAPGQILEFNGGKIIPGDHRFAVQLVDSGHVRVDLQAGACTGAEVISDKAITYIR